MNEQRDDLLTVAESAKALKVSPYTVYRWIAAGTMPAMRFSRKVIRIRRSDLESFHQTPYRYRRHEPENTVVREVAVAPYEAGTLQDEERREVKKPVTYYRAGMKEPAKGSGAALLRFAGILTEKEGGDLWRIIKADREASLNDPH